MALQPNQLNKFATFNCIWFMDVAGKDEIRTAAYKNRRGKIIRSGGIADTAGAALTTPDEDNLGVKGEYFIDNVQIQSYVSPNPHSGIANATRIEFEVTEPYSIGLFLQTLEFAAREEGYSNYLEAPFVLGVEFTGFDDNGSVSTIEKRVMLLKITKATFNVTAAGSVYSVQAIPFNHQALLNQVDNIPFNLSIKGDTVEEILTSLEEGGLSDVFGEVNIPGVGPQGVEVVGQEVTGTRSLIKALNDHEKELADAEDATPNEYEIIFPIDPSERGTKNDFASQLLAENFLDVGNQDMALPEVVYNQLNALYERRRVEIEENSRVYQFKQGTKIEKIIEEVILTSEWANDIYELKPDEEGYIEWFKILTFVEIIDGEKDRFGSLPKKYTYMVYPYKIHISALTPTSQPVNYNSLIRNAVKGYSYTYTGENKDILDFNIDIDYAWIQARANLAGRSLQQSDQGSNNQAREQEASARRSARAELAADQSVTSEQAGTTSTYPNYGGDGTDDERTRVARAYNDAIVNSNADLIKLKITIWGDPYFLADSDFGGFIARRQFPNQGDDGAMDHIRNEIDVLVKFAGAVDYKNSLLMPNTARQFTGVYRVTRVNSMFQSGMFKQELEMIRRRNPDSSSTDNVSNFIDAFNTGTTPGLKPATSGVNAGDLAPFLRQAEETELMFSIFGQLRLQDLTSALNITPFGLISQLNNFNQLFDQARQIRSAIGNLGSLAGNINLPGINAGSLQQLTQQLSGAQDFFNQAFTQIDVSSITQALNQDLSNVAGQFQGAIGQVAGQIQGAVGEFQGAVRTLSDLPGQLSGLPGQLSGLPGQLGGLASQAQRIGQFTAQGIQGANVPTAPPLPGLSSIVKPLPRPQNLNPTSTRLIETPDGPRRVVVGAGALDQSQINLREDAAAAQARAADPRNRFSGQ